MPQDEWKFLEDPWWDPSRRAVMFRAEKGGQQKLCAISDTALNDYFQTEDTKDAALANYHNHKEMVHSLAVRMIDDRCAKKDGVIFITRSACEKYWP